jgi:hypothetical protein
MVKDKLERHTMLQAMIKPSTVKELLTVVATLNDRAWAEFEVGFEQIRLYRKVIADREAADIVANHRFAVDQEVRVHELLFKNREGTLTESEEDELNHYMMEMDEALATTAEELLLLAKHRQSK